VVKGPSEELAAAALAARSPEPVARFPQVEPRGTAVPVAVARQEPRAMEETALREQLPMAASFPMVRLPMARAE